MPKLRVPKGPNKAGPTFRPDKGWEQFGNATNVQKFKRVFQRRRKRALDSVAQTIAQLAIDAGGFDANAPLTTQIKGGSTPLKDKGNLVRTAITTRNVSADSTFVGVLQSSPKFAQYMAVHNGATLKVTDKMRSMFQALAQVSSGEMQSSQLTGRARELYERSSGPWYPLATSTTAINIKARPFMERAFGSSQAKHAAVEKMLAAVDQTFRELAAGAKKG